MAVQKASGHAGQQLMQQQQQPGACVQVSCALSSCQVNTTDTDMQMHASATHGLSRSPTRANFQTRPLKLRTQGQVAE